MIYTSGSTGKPKGVMLRHIGICNYLTPHPVNIQAAFQQQDRTYLSVTTVAFDMSFKEHCITICNGNTLIFAGDEQMNDPKALADKVQCRLYQCHTFPTCTISACRRFLKSYIRL